MRAQTQMVFIFILIAVVIGLIVLFSYRGINSVIDTSEQIVGTKLVNSIRADVGSLRRSRGSSQIFEYQVPGKIIEICFVRTCTDIADCNQIYAGTMPLSMQSYVADEPQKNLFLLGKGNFVLDAIVLGSLDVDYNKDGISEDFHCFRTPGRLKLRILGTGTHATIQNA